MIEIDTLLSALAKAAAALSGAAAAYQEIKALAEGVRAAVGAEDAARIEAALAALQAQNDADFGRLDAQLATAAAG